MLKSAQAVWAILIAGLWMGGLAQAQQASEWSRCINKDGKFSAEVALGGCSSVIAADRETNSNRAVAYARRAKAYYDKREYDYAIADYAKAVEINPRDAAAYNNRGMAYRARGDNDNAIADYSQAIEINSSDAVLFNNRGIVYRAKGEHDRAIADHTRAIDIDPEVASSYNNRGLAYQAKGEYDRAIADHTTAIDIAPEFASAYFNRGLAYRAKGDDNKAIIDFTESIGINPKHSNAHHHRGLAYRAKGDNEKAATDLNKAEEIKAARTSHHGDLSKQRDLVDQSKATDFNAKTTDAALSSVSVAKATLPAPSIEKVSLPRADAPSMPFALVLKADLGTQQVTVLENGKVVHVWPISSGLRGYATPTGTFQPQWASRMWYSRQYNWTPMPFAVFFTRGVAFHGTNVTSRLGRSASHGCIRLATTNAAKLFKLVHKHGFTQTQIVVFGAARHDPPSMARRIPTARSQDTASSGVPSWAKGLFNR